VHWASERLAAASARPEGLLVGVSCHRSDELARAAALGCDFAVLGPVKPTPTHPHATLLGWDGFATAIEGTRIPVYALGGIVPADLRIAVARGAHGIAMRRGAW
jgi:8-oxo-dGTP diphosphatase